jgi:YVTN family beta-propeller protein
MIVITPDGKTAYAVSSADSSTPSSTVTPIDIATGTAGRPIKVGKYAVDIAITPDGKTAYVVGSAPGAVIPIDTATNKAGPQIKLGGYPYAIVITP